MMRITCSWCSRDMGVKPGEGETHGICLRCLAGEVHLPATTWLLQASAEIDNLDGGRVGTFWLYADADDELRRLAGERNRPTCRVDFREIKRLDDIESEHQAEAAERGIHPAIPMSERPYWGLGRYQDGLD